MKSILPLLLILYNGRGNDGKMKNESQKEDSNNNNLFIGSHMKAATDAINKLVDESIVNRVEEAEKEVSQMLLRNIEHHIQDAGKIFKSNGQEANGANGNPDKSATLSSVFDRAPCRDKLDSCEKLSQAGVCKTSRDAMRENCKHTCNYCHVMLDHEMQHKLAKELVDHDDGQDKVLTIKFRHNRGGLLKKHRKHHLDHLATDQVGLLGSDIKTNQQPELEKPENSETSGNSRESDDEQAAELERIKGEANKLLAAQRKIKQERLAEKERQEAERLLETEKKIKEEEQKAEEQKAVVVEVAKKHARKKKKKKQIVHKAPAKGTSFTTLKEKGQKDDDIPFLNEDHPYPLKDFVAEYDKSATLEEQPDPHEHAMHHNSYHLFQRDMTKGDNNGGDIPLDHEMTRKKFATVSKKKVESIMDKMYDNMLHSRQHTNLEFIKRKQDDSDDVNSPNLVLRNINAKDRQDETLTDDSIADDVVNTRHASRSDVSDDTTDTTTDSDPIKVTTMPHRYSPMLNEKDTVISKLSHHRRHHNQVFGDINEKQSNPLKGSGYDRKTYIDNSKIIKNIKPKIKADIQNLIDKAFGDVLSDTD